MKLINYKSDGVVKLGIQLEGGILEVEKLKGGKDLPKNTDEVILGGEAVLKELEDLIDSDLELIAEEEIEYAPAVLNPSKVLCVGLNYAAHVKEGGKDDRPLPTAPVWFNKFGSSLIGHKEKIKRCTVSEQHDYEAEIVVIIGKKGKHIPKDQAMDHVFGYTLGNDISARDLQFRSGQWLIGKAADTFGPIGPCIVTADSMDIENANLVGEKNGEVRQSTHVKNMIFDIPTLINDISNIMELNPGDIIFSGTPEGVIMGRMAPLEKDWLQAGDVVKVKSDQIGELINEIV